MHWLLTEIWIKMRQRVNQLYRPVQLLVKVKEKVARLERKRLERITADCVAPMEAEPSIEGRPPGEQERQPRGQVARPKRARGSGRPETG